MPTLRTEASELAVAFGVLGLDPAHPLNMQDLDRTFQGSLSPSKYQAFLGEYSNQYSLHSRMHRVGAQLRSNEPLFSRVDSLEWAGPNRQAATATASADLIVANTPISVKAASNVVANPSPHNLIVNLPGGQAFSQNEENWYISQDLPGLQALYDYVRNSDPTLSYLPARVDVFESKASRADRKQIQKVISSYATPQRRQFIGHYLPMCHLVAVKSATIFNSRITQSLASRSRVSVIENLMRWFFRLDSISYVLCGIDGDSEFAVRIPSITQWKAQWNLDHVHAAEDLARRQSVVDFKLDFSETVGQSSLTAPFHAEIRWSHGRFCGVPEGKLYKDFQWDDTPVFKSLIRDDTA